MCAVLSGVFALVTGRPSFDYASLMSLANWGNQCMRGAVMMVMTMVAAEIEVCGTILCELSVIAPSSPASHAQTKLGPKRED